MAGVGGPRGGRCRENHLAWTELGTNRLTFRIRVGASFVTWQGDATRATTGKRRGGLPEVSIDYRLPASAGGVGVAILVARERRSRTACAAVVPRKGNTGQFAARRINADWERVVGTSL